MPAETGGPDRTELLRQLAAYFRSQRAPQPATPPPADEFDAVTAGLDLHWPEPVHMADLVPDPDRFVAMLRTMKGRQYLAGLLRDDVTCPGCRQGTVDAMSGPVPGAWQN